MVSSSFRVLDLLFRKMELHTFSPELSLKLNNLFILDQQLLLLCSYYEHYC